jgi:hypothetical protein
LIVSLTRSRPETGHVAKQYAAAGRYLPGRFALSVVPLPHGLDHSEDHVTDINDSRRPGGAREWPDALVGVGEVTKRYSGSVPALDRVSMHVAAGPTVTDPVS